MSLLFGFNLQSVLDLTEEAISPVKIDNFLARDEFQSRQSAERIQRDRFPQKDVPAAMNELERLHDELDFANPASPKFYVTFQRI